MRSSISVLALMSLLASPAGADTGETEAIVQLRALAPAVAHDIVLAAVEDCTRRGFKVSAAVVDRNGNLAAFLRDPRSGPHTVKISQRKAFTSATSQMSTAQLSSRTDLNFAPDMLLIVGGVPISFNGHFYGGVAVAGARPQIDEQCAKAGVAAVSETMDFVE